jgi:type VI secretion system protein ImpF
MARAKTETPVTQSLLDRLSNYATLPSGRADSIGRYKEGVKRDIRWLLNTRRAVVPEIDDYPMAAKSVFNYGLPDVNELKSGDNSNGLEANVLEAIRQTIRVHETRIRDLRVTPSRVDVLNRSLKFHVEGKILVENSLEDISFDTFLEITSGECEVK